MAPFEKARVNLSTNRVLEPWRYLALAVIQTAFVDVSRGQVAALDWLLGNSAAMRFWCEVARVEPGYVRRAARRGLEGGDVR